MHRRHEPHDHLAIQRDHQVMPRVSQKLPRRVYVDGVVEHALGDAGEEGEVGKTS